LKDSIQLTENVTNIKLKTFKEIPPTFRLLDRKIENNGRILLRFNKPIENPSLRITDNPDLESRKLVEFNQTRDSAFIWLPELNFDTVSVEIVENKIPIDTTVLKRSQNTKYDRALVITDNLSNQRVDQVRNVVFTSSSPIKSVDPSKIKFYEDTTQRTNYQLSLDNNNLRKANLRFKWRSKR